MLILALDTTSRAGSVALARDGHLVDHHMGDPSRTHGERLPADIIRLLERQGLTVADVDVYAVAAGPGSFTGLRVGIATIQGLALAHARLVVPVSALAALAHGALVSPSAHADVQLIAACMDAHRQEVFSALYQKSERGRVSGARGTRSAVEEEAERAPAGLDVIEPPCVGRAEVMLNAWSDHLRGRTVCFVGDGALVYREVLTGRLHGAARFIEPLPCLASSIALMASVRAGAGEAVAPHAIQPVYVRRPDAELARDKARRVRG